MQRQRNSISRCGLMAIAGPLLVFVAARPAAADFVVTNTNRYVSAAAEMTSAGSASTQHPGPPTGEFVDNATAVAYREVLPNYVQLDTQADQASLVPATGAAMVGFAQVTAQIVYTPSPTALPGIYGSVEDSDTNLRPASYLRVAFTLAEPHAYTLGGRLFEQVMPLPNFDVLSAAAHVQLIDRTNTLSLYVLEGAPGETLFEESGILPAGDYELIASAYLGNEMPLSTTEWAVAQFEFEFSVVPVPEPTSLVLAGSAGCLWLVRPRRSRRAVAATGKTKLCRAG